jgi:hypothetical protein
MNRNIINITDKAFAGPGNRIADSESPIPLLPTRML